MQSCVPFFAKAISAVDISSHVQCRVVCQSVACFDANYLQAQRIILVFDEKTC